jgi:hypothetical protein
MVLLLFLWGGLQMGNDLMAEEIEIDPLRGASPFRTTQKATVESACCVKIINREGNVKWGERHLEVSLRSSYDARSGEFVPSG